MGRLLIDEVQEDPETIVLDQAGSSHRAPC